MIVVFILPLIQNSQFTYKVLGFGTGARAWLLGFSSNP